MADTDQINARRDARGGHNDDGDARGEARGNPFGRGTQKADKDLANIRIPAGLIRQFDVWYQGQTPGVQQRKSKNAYYEVAFRLGLERLQEALPPVQSLDDRLAELGLKAS